MKLVAFDTHPIQYRVPVFRHLAEEIPAFEAQYFGKGFEGDRWWFKERGHARDRSWGITLDGIKETDLAISERGLSAKYVELKRVLDRSSAEAVVMFGYYLPEHWMLRWLCGQRQIPLVFVGETFSTQPYERRNRINRAMLEWFFSGVSQAVALGQRHAEFYRSVGMSSHQIHIGGYCVNNAFFRAKGDERSAIRAAWRAERKIGSDEFVVLMVGRLFGRKRPRDLLLASQAIAPSHPHRTIFCGDGVMLDSLRSEAAKMPHIQFEGFSDQPATRRAYYGADVLVMPSDFETWGLVANEAAVCGLPTIATRNCGVVGELIVDGKTGLEYPVGDVEALSQQLKRLVSDRELTRRLGKAAHDLCEARFDVSHFAETLLHAARSATGEGMLPAAREAV